MASFHKFSIAERNRAWREMGTQIAIQAIADHDDTTGPSDFVCSVKYITDRILEATEGTDGMNVKRLAAYHHLMNLVAPIIGE